MSSITSREKFDHVLGSLQLPAIFGGCGVQRGELLHVATRHRFQALLLKALEVMPQAFDLLRIAHAILQPQQQAALGLGDAIGARIMARDAGAWIRLSRLAHAAVARVAARQQKLLARDGREQLRAPRDQLLVVCVG